MKPGQRLLRLGLICTGIALVPSLLAQEPPGMLAYKQLIHSATFPKDKTPEDEAAVALIRKHVGDITNHLVRTLSPQSVQEPKALAVFNILPTDTQLQIARAVVKAYSPQQRTPVSLFLAARGDTNDMEKISAEITAQPDGWGVGLAVAIIEHRNDAGLTKLREMKGRTKGAWQEVPAVKAALSRPRP